LTIGSLRIETSLACATQVPCVNRQSGYRQSSIVNQIVNGAIADPQLNAPISLAVRITK